MFSLLVSKLRFKVLPIQSLILLFLEFPESPGLRPGLVSWAVTVEQAQLSFGSLPIPSFVLSS